MNASRTILLPLVLSGALLGATPARADLEALDRVPMPDGATRQILALDLIQNGLRVSIASLDVRGSGEETLAFYREAWAETIDDGPGFVESTAGDWRMISRLENEENRVVQLRDGGDGVETIVSVLALEGAGPIPELYPVPPGGETLSTTTSTDEGIGTATTTVIETLQSAGETAAFYRDAMRRDGWISVSDRRDAGPVVLLLKRRGVRLELIVSDIDGAGSLAVINRLEDT